MKIFIIRSQRPTGPYSDTEITDMLRHGEVTLSEPAWKEGDPDWSTVANVMGIEEPPPLSSSIAQPPPMPVRQNEPAFHAQQYVQPHGPAFSQNIPQEAKGSTKGLIVAGYICSVAGILLCPPLFILVGLIIGIILLTKGESAHGISILVLAIILGGIGMIIGAALMSR